MQRTKRAPDRAGTAPPRTTRLHEASRWALHPQVRGLFIAFRMTRGFPTGVRVGGVGFFEGRTSTRSTLAERLASTRAHPMPARADIGAGRDVLQALADTAAVLVQHCHAMRRSDSEPSK